MSILIRFGSKQVDANHQTDFLKSVFFTETSLTILIIEQEKKSAKMFINIRFSLIIIHCNILSQYLVISNCSIMKMRKAESGQ